MTREEMINVLKMDRDLANFDPDTGEEVPTNELNEISVEALDMAIDALEDQRWIPCSERLPEANGRYLGTRGLNACGALWNRVYIINYSDLMGLKKEKIWWQGNVGKSDFKQLDDVLAWMPLPEPYMSVE